MTWLLVLGFILILLVLIGAASASASPPPAPRPLPRRPVPLDPIIDPVLDPLIEPWAVPLSGPADDRLFDEPNEPDQFEPGGGDFGGGGASGSWDEPDDHQG